MVLDEEEPKDLKEKLREKEVSKEPETTFDGYTVKTAFCVSD